MGSGSAGTNWKEEFAKCTRRLEDAATLMDAIDSHQAVLHLLFGRMFTSIWRAPESSQKFCYRYT